MSRIVFVLLVVATVLSIVLGGSSKENCGKNQEWSNCVTLCPPTCCQEYTTTVCPQVCKVGCRCKEGYLRTMHGTNYGECVLPCDCNCK